MSDELVRPKVLVVDDEEENLDLYKWILDGIADLICVDNKSDAIKKIRDEVYDAALIDVRLKRKDVTNRDGIDVAEFIRAIGHSDTEIILVTGYPLFTGNSEDQAETESRISQLRIFATLYKGTVHLDQELPALMMQVAAARKDAISKKEDVVHAS